jgi:hypothetical protein
MVLVVQMSHCFTKRLDTSSRAVFAASHGDVNRVWSLEATLDVYTLLEVAVIDAMLCRYRRPPPARPARGLPSLSDRLHSHAHRLARSSKRRRSTHEMDRVQRAACDLHAPRGTGDGSPNSILKTASQLIFVGSQP